jgi:hypothetical protein
LVQSNEIYRAEEAAADRDKAFGQNSGRKQVFVAQLRRSCSLLGLPAFLEQAQIGLGLDLQADLGGPGEQLVGHHRQQDHWQRSSST